MSSILDSLLHRLIRNGLRRGLLEGSVAWIVIGAAAVVVRYVARPESPLVAREKLRLGESVLVAHVPAPEERRPRRRRWGMDAGNLPGDS